MTIRLLHAADLHLDAPLSGVSSQQRHFADATLRAFTKIVDTAIEHRVDAVLLAGDLYEKRDQSVRSRLHCVAQIQRLHAAKIRSFIVRGNHDPLSADPGGLSLPESCTVFDSQWSEVPVLKNGAVHFRVQGISFGDSAVHENLSRRFSRQGPEPTVGLLHCNVTGTTGHANYAPCSVEDLNAAGLNYWALGHVHNREQFQLTGGGIAAYPGNSQGRHAKETGPRGCLLIDLDESGASAPRVRFVACDVVRWHVSELDVGQGQTLDGLVDDAVQQGRALQAQAPELGHAIRFRLIGRGALHAQLVKASEREQLEQAIVQRLGTLGIAVDRLVDESSALVDVDAAAQGGGLPALVAQWLEATPAEVEALWNDAAELRALDARLGTLGVRQLADDRMALVHQAALLAIAELAERS